MKNLLIPILLLFTGCTINYYPVVTGGYSHTDTVYITITDTVWAKDTLSFDRTKYKLNLEYIKFKAFEPYPEIDSTLLRNFIPNYEFTKPIIKEVPTPYGEIKMFNNESTTSY